jgi:hypothetical protein
MTLGTLESPHSGDLFGEFSPGPIPGAREAEMRLALHKARLRTDIRNSNGGHSKKVLDRVVSL